MRSSQAAVDLIVASEVTSKEVYAKLYQHPEWPGGASGITIAIGYDCGFASPQRISDDWASLLPPSMITALARVSGKTGKAAQELLSSVRNQVSVPWDAAMHVFETIDMPKWEGLVLKACPNSENLPADCFGVITSIAYNRGASFTKAGDRYEEMRAIRADILSGNWSDIPVQIRSMKRLWDTHKQAGLITRRENEAVLFEQGLTRAVPLAVEQEAPSRLDTGDDKSDTADLVTSAGSEDINVQPVKAVYDLKVEIIQRKLLAMHYHELGDPDGFWGGKTSGAISAFMNDRGQPRVGQITPEFEDELNKAIAEGWSRPIAPSRANATAKDIAPKVASVNQTWWQKFWGWVLGVPAFFTAGFKGVFGDQGSDPSSYIGTIKNFFGMIPAEFYFLAIAGVAVLIIVQATKAQNATVKAYQRGEIN
jgi:hypothetical protein